MQKLLRRALDGLYATCGGVAAVMLCILLLIVLAQMATRWISIGIPGLTTYAGYFMAATTFFALSYALTKGAHIKVTFIIERLGPYQRVAKIWYIGISLAIAVLFSYFAVKATYYSYVLAEISQAQDATIIWVPQLTMSIGASVLAIALLDRFVQEVHSNDETPLVADSKSKE